MLGVQAHVQATMSITNLSSLYSTQQAQSEGQINLKLTYSSVYKVMHKVEAHLHQNTQS